MDTYGRGEGVEFDRRQNAEAVLDPDKSGGSKTAMFRSNHAPLILSVFDGCANGVIPCGFPKSLRFE